MVSPVSASKESTDNLQVEQQGRLGHRVVSRGTKGLLNVAVKVACAAAMIEMIASVPGADGGPLTYIACLAMCTSATGGVGALPCAEACIPLAALLV